MLNLEVLLFYLGINLRDTLKKKELSGNFEIKDAAFIYAGARTPLFRNFSLSFSVAPGQTVFCIGENGTGKSTLACLMVGLVNPARGEVLLDGLTSFKLHLSGGGDK